MSARRGTPVPSAIRNGRIDARVRGVAPGHQRRARGRAHRLHVERIENRTPVREPVNVRRADVLPAIEAAVGKAKVVNEQEDDVWFTLKTEMDGRGMGAKE